MIGKDIIHMSMDEYKSRVVVSTTFSMPVSQKEWYLSIRSFTPYFKTLRLIAR